MFEEDENQCRELIRQINEHNTSMLIMEVGAPKSEIWVDTYRARLPRCWALSSVRRQRLHVALRSALRFWSAD